WARPIQWRTSAERSIALLGMQAKYGHSPPSSLSSTTATDLPPRATVVATISPAEPPPSTTTSYVSMGRSTFLLFPCPMAPRAVGVARRSDVSDSSMHLDRPQSMQYHPLMF